jgi:hypothetical protein
LTGYELDDRYWNPASDKNYPKYFTAIVPVLLIYLICAASSVRIIKNYELEGIRKFAVEDFEVKTESK